MSLALLWYAVDARKWYKGPKINVEHLVNGSVLESSEGEVVQVVHVAGKGAEKMG